MIGRNPAAARGLSVYALSVGALAAGLSLCAGASAQLPAHAAPARAAPAPLRRIAMLADTLPDLGPLRGALRAGDAPAAADAVARIEDTARAARAPFRARLEAHGGRIVEHFWIVDGCVVEVPAAALEALAADPAVVQLVEDARRGPGGMPLPIRTSTNAQNHRTDAVQARGVLGAGVTLAVIDSGIDSLSANTGRPHSAFYVNGNPTNMTGGGLGGSRLRAAVQVGVMPPDDVISHGTRVAGVAAGARWNMQAGSDDGHAPRASIVSYSLADDMVGITTLATMVRAWQRCAQEAAQFGTKVAVLSYEGTADPLSPEQQAMDACADLADVAVAAMAGNAPSAQFFYQGASNVLAVGAVAHDTHVAASFTARGPLMSAPGLRTYPHLVANGENIEMPEANLESGSAVRSGTSYSAPQVAGAALLFRSVAAGASADETRAAILATLDDASAPNPSAGAAIGHGYLRVDRLVDLGQGGRINGLFTRGQLTLGAPVFTTSLNMTAGEVACAALAFSRRHVASTAWANVDLRVVQNGEVLAESSGAFDTHERVVFRARATGSVQIQAVARTFEQGTVDQEFGLAVAASPLPLVLARGNGCPGGPGAHRVHEVEPPSHAATFGNAASDALLGGTPHRTQQWIDTSTIPGAFNMRGLALRHDEQAASGPWPRSWVELEVTLDLTNAAPTSMSANFAQNLGRLATQVVQRKLVVLPAQPAPNAMPSNFAVVIPFDQAFDRLYDPQPLGTGGVLDMIVDVRVHASSAGAQALRYPLDAVTGFAGGAATVTGAGPNATTGTLTMGAATVLGLVDQLGVARIPALASRGAPSIGQVYELTLSSARATAPAVVSLGLSGATLGGAMLPIHLGPFGAEGCFLLTSLDASLGATTSTLGVASFLIPVPNAPSLFGLSIFHQGIVVDPAANVLGVSMTGALEAVLGQ